jgi:heme A synthase
MSTYRFALTTLGATFVLLLIGGIVHGTGSSLACPDWPLCFGSFFPEMKGNVLVEHGHRLAAAFVGLLTVGLCGLLLCRRQERLLHWLGGLAVLLVCFQGLLGGLTVIYRLPTLISAAHLSTSMLFLSLLVVIAALLRPTPGTPVPAELRHALLLTTALTYVQISIGGLVRHTGAGLACLDLPLCRGQVLPLGEHPTVLLHALHRLGAVVVAALCIAVALRLRRFVGSRALLVPALVLVQIGLGVMSVLSYLGLFYVTAHLGVAALLLGSLVWWTVRTGPA